ncbi:transglutaminase domain-containing protein [Pseudomonas oryzihabitans]|uniref:transglutaminase domain-containing protein n=1 Tax=Pseudomonas oryzihabitans TaxID=47885 RepID=UPI002854E78B|nr:transglutaminase-like domain-containing protein [Pseudomonas psychrotolerans]MDR6679153.1 transglutaminase-like putative cysteine protease [Pseudomonas psychrotolerans]
MEAAMPLSLDGKTYDWQVKSSVPFVVDGENLVFSAGDFSPYQVKHVKVYFEGMGAKSERNFTSGSDTYPLTANPSPELIALSKSFSGLSHQEKIRAVYQWMVANIAFTGIDRQVEGANSALSSKSGDCTEHMLLAGELLARNGVRVRRALGLVVPAMSRKVTSVNLHNWLEAYHRGGWFILDSAYKTYQASEAEGKYLGLHYYKGEEELSYRIFGIRDKRLQVFIE